MEFAGEFETHLTLASMGIEEMAALREWGAGRDLKYVYILLDRGAQPSQPMVTWRTAGILSKVRREVSEICGNLETARFPVTRVKIEAAIGNEQVPQTDTEAFCFHPSRYFEHHVKLIMPPDADCGAIIEVAMRHAAHLSRNVLRQRPDGLVERFVTQRCHSVGLSTATNRLENFLAVLASLRAPVVRIEEEFVVYDSNEALDAGWLPEQGL